MLKIKSDINQQIVDLHFVKSEEFSFTWICGSRQRDTTLSEWKFQLNNFAVKGWMTSHTTTSHYWPWQKIHVAEDIMLRSGELARHVAVPSQRLVFAWLYMILHEDLHIEPT